MLARLPLVDSLGLLWGFVHQSTIIVQCRASWGRIVQRARSTGRRTHREDIVSLQRESPTAPGTTPLSWMIICTAECISSPENPTVAGAAVSEKAPTERYECVARIVLVSPCRRSGGGEAALSSPCSRERKRCLSPVHCCWRGEGAFCGVGMM